MARATSKYHTEKALLFELLHEDYHPGVGAGLHARRWSHQLGQFHFGCTFDSEIENIFDSKTFGKFSKKLILLKRLAVVKKYQRPVSVPI
jgi:hypothetical protein